MDFRVLGPVEIRSVSAGPPQQSVVLAALAVDAGRLVPVPVLVDRVWGQPHPRHARRTLHTYIARLRRLLERAGGDSVLVVRRAGGYVLEVDPGRVDWHRFRHLVERAHDPRCPDPERVALLREGLGLWRAEPLAGLPGEWAARTREAWQRQRVAAIVAWAQAELRISSASSVIEPLADLLNDNPLAEPLAGVLMRALYAAGRTADALECYTTMRWRLVDELGVDPGPELQEIHRAILRGDVAVALRDPAPVAAQLPPATDGFVGRVEELIQLDALLPAGAGGQPRTVVISTVSGMAGVGKTALAVRWAHRVADRFPDGQLYVNLRGFDQTGSPMSSAEAIRAFLYAFAVPAERVPPGLDAQAALYRSLLAGRRVLVVLDNARDAEQVRPLLPGAPGCLAVVTSRSHLTGLVTAENAHPLTLDLLSTVEARELLSRRVGAGRVAAEPEAVDEIVVRCGRLPLGLAIVAARAATHPRFPLATLARELRGRLDAFDGGDPASDLRAVFSWSYRAVSAPAARLFRMLGPHPGPDIGVAAAASLAAAATGDARAMLAELTRAHLLTEQTPDRYAFHDLLRAYATELTGTEDPRAGLHRVLDHYLHTAHAAAIRQDTFRDPITLAPPQPGVMPETFHEYGQAMDWFAANLAVLLAVARHAADTGFDAHAWQLGWALGEFLDRRGHWHEQEAIQEVALNAARRVGDRHAEAQAQRMLGSAHLRLGSHDEAHRHFQQTLDLCRALADHASAANTHLCLGLLFDRQGEHRKAVRQAEQALNLYVTIDHALGQARALNSIGWYHTQLGHHEQALAYCERALGLHRQLGNNEGTAATLDSIGHAHHQLGDHARAAECYRLTIELCRSTGDLYHEASTLGCLGDTYQAAGSLDAARDAWRQALDLLERLDHPDADQVRAKLG